MGKRIAQEFHLKKSIDLYYLICSKDTYIYKIKIKQTLGRRKKLYLLIFPINTNNKIKLLE